MKIKGIVSADRPCELCGNTRVERLVVIEKDDGSMIRVGSTCAGYMIHGKKSRKNGEAVNVKARAAQLAADLMDKHGTDSATLRKIARAVFNRYGFATDVVDGRVELASFF
jgi:ribosome-binding protein aMBF1 (putative translation factor)